MTERSARVFRWEALARGLGALAILLASSSLALAVVNSSSIHSVEDANPLEIIIAFTFAIVGGLIASRLPRNPTGWLFLLIAVLEGVVGITSQLSLLAFVTHPGSLPAAAWFAWVSSWMSGLIYPTGAAAVTFLLIPYGHLPSRRWRFVLGAAFAMTVVIVLLTAFAPGALQIVGTLPPINNPVGIAALGSLTSDTSLGFTGFSYLGGLLVLVAAASAPVVRMRRSRGDERQQLKWIAYTIIATSAVNLAAAVVSLLIPAVAQSQLVWLIPIALGYGLALPISVGLAIFKYRLYDIDIVLNRTLVYTTLAVCITAVYVGIAVGIGSLVGSGGKPNLGLSILATAIVAVGFQPLRARVQRLANRLVYGKRATPYEVLSEFSSRVGEAYASHELLQRMARVLGEATAANLAEVWLKSGDHLRRAAAYPIDAPEREPVSLDGREPIIGGVDHVVSVRQQDEFLGALTVTKRKSESLTPIERKLLDDLAHQAGLVLKNVGLTAALEVRLDELRASRQRLVAAQDDERRRLERNLHDGAQQHLVALKVKLGLAAMLLRKDPEKARTTLEQLQGDADEALQTLRDLARGIYPPLLADKGLRAALESQARKATIPVDVDADGVSRYPQDIEAAVYFCCLEALQNVQKYAHATKVTIRLRQAGSSLRVEVEDDGSGFDPALAQRGAGLTNMEDRLDALGGSLSVVSEPGFGTRLAAELPLSATALAAEMTHLG